jgi:carboxyl-terminal processing protease
MMPAHFINAASRLTHIAFMAGAFLLPATNILASENTGAVVQWGISAAENEQLGIRAHQETRYQIALQYFQKAYEIDPSMGSAAYGAAASASKLKQTDLAFTWLQNAYRVKYFNIRQLKNSKDFDVLHQDARWDKLMTQFETASKKEAEFWNGSTWKTPYKESLTEDERVAGLSKVWSEIKYNFVFVEKLQDINWDGLYLQYLPKIRAAKTNLEYYQLLSEMVALLQDGHTNVYPSQQEYDKYQTKPLIYIELMEGKVMVRWVGDSELQQAGLKRGHEIVSVNGMPVQEYSEKVLAPYISSGTRQDKDVRIYQYQFLQGPIGEKIAFAARDENGVVTSYSAKRVSNEERSNAIGGSSYTFKMLEGGIAHVWMTTFESTEVTELFLKDFPEISKAKALILDVRRNGGGNAHVGYDILKTLGMDVFPTSKATIRNYRSIDRSQHNSNPEYTYPVYKVTPDANHQFKGPVVVLTSGQTFSAAEDFVVAFKNMKRGLIIGGATAGSTGSPISFNLPGGGSGRVCVKNDTFPDGTEFVGKGIVPDIKVAQTVADFRNRVDTVLNAAISALNQQLK